MMAATIDDGKKYKLLCLDGSTHSEKALDWFFERVYQEGDDVGLIHIHVLPDLPAFGLYAQGVIVTDIYENDIQRTILESKETIKKYKEACSAKGVHPRIFLETSENSVGHTISKIANNHGSMIILGQRGLGAIRRTLFGSVSDFVLHHTHIPVIIIPPAETNK